MLSLQRPEKSEKGFTLVELMIVVAIIGILAAIAIPNFRNYQLKSKTAEAKTNLGAIKTSQEAYLAEEDTYLACAATPPNVSLGQKADFLLGGIASYQTIGFAPSGQVYYSYMVMPATAVANNIRTEFVAIAEGDLDANGAGAAGGVALAATCNDADYAAMACNADHGRFRLNSANSFADENAGKW